MSLHPLGFEEALAGLMRVKPEPELAKQPKEDKEKPEVEPHDR